MTKKNKKYCCKDGSSKSTCPYKIWEDELAEIHVKQQRLSLKNDEIHILQQRVDVANKLMDMTGSDGKLLYTSDFIKTKILKL